jgi:hypothetical protein
LECIEINFGVVSAPIGFATSKMPAFKNHEWQQGAESFLLLVVLK